MKLSRLLYFFMLLLMPFSVFGQEASFRKIDSAKKLALANVKNDTAYFHACFVIAAEYIAMDMYDSAQIWLNYIGDRLPLRKPSFFNFYISVEQSEMYYYSGLLVMDMQESERILRFAKALNDSILLATGYNFVGLANMNLDSTRKAIPYFDSGMRYVRQPPYPDKYLSASQPHHLLGNLAEGYYKLGKYDSSKLYAFRARDSAQKINSYRGIAVANNQLGLVYARLGMLDSAILFQQMAISIGLQHNQHDVSLVSMGATAGCYHQKGQPDTAIAILKRAVQLLKEDTLINTYFSNLFLEDAIQLFKKLGLKDELIEVMEMKATLTARLVKRNDAQVATLVKAGVMNEMRAANLKLSEARQKQALSNTRFMIALLVLVGLVILFFIYRYYHNKQLREIAIRNKISQDLHDDIGATLSSIQIYGELAGSTLEKDTGQSKKMIGEMTEQTKDLMSRMSDVIWSMKPVEDDKSSFSNRLKNFSNELLVPKNIQCHIDMDEQLNQRIADPVTRKNILLIIKEAMNNIAKYSEAVSCSVQFKEENGMAVLTIADDGKGMDLETAVKGNGLDNMKKRTESLKGKYIVQSSPGAGVTIQCIFPIAIFSHRP